MPKAKPMKAPDRLLYTSVTKLPHTRLTGMIVSLVSHFLAAIPPSVAAGIASRCNVMRREFVEVIQG